MRTPVVLRAILPVLFLPWFLSAQNQPPQVVITDVAVDEPSQSVTITYDLLDTEYDPCEVWFGLSLDGGETFLSDNGSAYGDLGPGIQPGADREITWFAKDLPDIYQAVVRVVADDGQPVDIQALVDQVDESEVLERLTTLAVKRHHSANPANLDMVGDSLRSAFEQYGFQVKDQPAYFQTYSYPNVLGRQGGWVHEDTTIVVDAHYDGVSAGPAADDNATGVVGTLEAARILSKIPFRKSIRYIGFAFEEQGLVGSNEYVNKGGIEPWEVIDGVLNMEMIGYFSNDINSQTIPAGFDLLFPAATAAIQAQANRGNFLAVVGNTVSQPLIDAFVNAADTYVPELRTISLTVPGNGAIAPDLRRSDHARFWDAGYHALMLTDGADTRNKNYHTAKDVVDSLNMTFLANNIRAVLATAATLAEPMHAGSDMFPLSNLVSTHDHGSGPAWSVRIRPNPATGQLRLTLEGPLSSHLDLRMFSADGREWLSRTLGPQDAGADVLLSLKGVPAGAYLLVLTDGEHSLTRSVMVE